MHPTWKPHIKRGFMTTLTVTVPKDPRHSFWHFQDSQDAEFHDVTCGKVRWITLERFERKKRLIPPAETPRKARLRCLPARPVLLYYKIYLLILQLMLDLLPNGAWKLWRCRSHTHGSTSQHIQWSRDPAACQVAICTISIWALSSAALFRWRRYMDLWCNRLLGGTYSECLFVNISPNFSGSKVWYVVMDPSLDGLRRYSKHLWLPKHHSVRKSMDTKNSESQWKRNWLQRRRGGSWGKRSTGEAHFWNSMRESSRRVTLNVMLFWNSRNKLDEWIYRQLSSNSQVILPWKFRQFVRYSQRKKRLDPGDGAGRGRFRSSSWSIQKQEWGNHFRNTWRDFLWRWNQIPVPV